MTRAIALGEAVMMNPEVFVVVPTGRRRRQAWSFFDVLEAMACAREKGVGTKVYRASDGKLIARRVPGDYMAFMSKLAGGPVGSSVQP